MTCVAHNPEPCGAQECARSGPPLRWHEERRFQLRCGLDTAFFHLYGLSPDDAACILDTLPIVRRKDEGKFNGDDRTNRVILEICDTLAESQRTGQPYATRVDPLRLIRGDAIHLYTN
jgi:hypothetical protein